MHVTVPTETAQANGSCGHSRNLRLCPAGRFHVRNRVSGAHSVHFRYGSMSSLPSRASQTCAALSSSSPSQGLSRPGCQVAGPTPRARGIPRRHAENCGANAPVIALAWHTPYTIPTFAKPCCRFQKVRGPVAQLDRAFDYESKGRAFESLRVLQFPFMTAPHPECEGFRLLGPQRTACLPQGSLRRQRRRALPHSSSGFRAASCSGPPCRHDKRHRRQDVQDLWLFPVGRISNRLGARLREGDRHRWIITLPRTLRREFWKPQRHPCRPARTCSSPGDDLKEGRPQFVRHGPGHATAPAQE